MNGRKFTKSARFIDSYSFLRTGDKAQIICDVEHYSKARKGTIVEGEIIFLSLNSELPYIVLEAPCLDMKGFRTFYTLYPITHQSYRWKLKLKDTFLGSQLRERARLERKDKFQLNLLA